jgi:predicted porin
LLIVFASQCAFAQGDVADEVAVLRELIEDQNRLLNDQSTQLESLTRRVAELEGRTGVADVPSPGIVDSTTDSVLPDSPRAGSGRTAAIGAGEISLAHKSPLRTGKETQIIDEAVVLSENVDIYGSLRTFAEVGASDPTLNDGSSRIGFRLGRQFGDGTTIFGRVEWKVNLVDNDSDLFASDSPAGGGIVVRTETTDTVISTRLGYLGARFDDVGELSFGKQWSVYYDVAGWTDNFNVYGGSGLSVYPAGTDGGVLGSGRADNAVIFRNERGRVSYGLQTQLKTAAQGDDYKGLGGSLIVSPTDSWDIGLAFAGARVKGNFERLTGDAETGVATLGARYHSGPWNAAFGMAKWKNHEAVFFQDDTLIYDGVGAEFYASYAYSERLNFYGGLNYTDPDINDPRVDPDFGVEFLIFGASFFDSDKSFAYIEGLLSNSEDVNGERVDSVLSAGYRFDF